MAQPILPPDLPQKTRQAGEVKRWASEQMNHLIPLTHRRRASSPRKLVVVAAFLLVAQSAMSVSLQKNIVELEIQFSPESSVLSDLSAQRLASQLPCVNSLVLEVAFIKTSGDSASSNMDGIAQMNLASERANVLRSLLRDLGFSDSRIFAQAEAMVAVGTGNQGDSLPGGRAKIEYVGTCKAGAVGKPECDRLCSSRP